jgi:hypothetical protein
MTLNPKKMHPPTMLGCVVLIVVLFALYHFTLGRHHGKG